VRRPRDLLADEAETHHDDRDRPATLWHSGFVDRPSPAKQAKVSTPARRQAA
jgi:hypothetical protein